MNSIYSLGHSNHPWSYFEQLVNCYRIGCIVDVRSKPYSRWPAYSRPMFRIRLNETGVSYVYLGDGLGGQPHSGPADYDQMSRTIEFGQALDALLDIAARCNVAMVCAEGEPLTCHRFLLVSRALATRGVLVQHILKDGTVEPHTATLARLIAKLKLPPLLQTDETANWAYRRQEEKLSR